MTTGFDIRELARVMGATRWCPHSPTPPQAAFLGLTCLEALYGGAAGGGKSDALLMDALAGVQVPAYSAILFRRTYTDLALPGAIMDRSHTWLAGTAARWNDRDKTWTFPSGATLTFGYLDGPRDQYRYQGSEFQYIGFDELTQFTERQYRYLFSRLRRTSQHVTPKMRGATNPGDIGHEWVKERFIDEPEDRIFVPAKLEDNPHLNQEEYDVALSQLDPVTRKQLRDGLWIRDTSGLVYSAWDTSKNRAMGLPDDSALEWHYILGADFGVVDPTAYVVLAFARQSPICYVVRSEKWSNMSPSEAGAKVKEWSKDFEFDAIIGDMGGMGKAFDAEFRKRFYIPMRAAQKQDKLGFIKLLNGDLSNGLIKVLPGNDALIKELTQLAWSDDKCQKEHPALPNHLTDALLYGWRECRHWDWEEDDPQDQDTELARKMRSMMERRERLIARNKKRNNPDENDWILGPWT